VVAGKGGRKVNAVQIYVHMPVNAMIPVETVPWIGGGEIKGSSGGDEFQAWYSWYIVRNFVNATVYLHTTKQ
jgi:hypothetical protein